MRYVASAVYYKDLAVRHGIFTVDANSYAEAYGIMKKLATKKANGGKTHISAVMLVETIMKANGEEELYGETFE